jgi:hypothetical protein
MRRGIACLLVSVIALVPGSALAGKRHHHHHKHKPAGVKGVVLDSTCPGACAVPPPPAPLYAGSVTVTVSRASSGAQVASQAATNGHFRIRVKRGTYTSAPCRPVCTRPVSQSRSRSVPRHASRNRDGPALSTAVGPRRSSLPA